MTSILFTPDSTGLLIGTDRGKFAEVFLTVDRLLSQGCEWLEDYEKSHPNLQKNPDNSPSFYPCY